MNHSVSSQNNRSVVVIPTKSVGIAILLTFFFGSLGLFYSTIAGAIIMLLIELLIFVFSLATLGFGLALFSVTHLVCIVWGAAAAHNYNKKWLRNSPR